MTDLFSQPGGAAGAPAPRPRLHSDTRLYAAIFDLGKFVAETTENFHRGIKRTYGDTLIDASLMLNRLFREANIARDAAKLPYLDEILRVLADMEFAFRILRDMGWMKTRTFERSIPLTASVAAQTHKLKDRFAPVSQ